MNERLATPATWRPLTASKWAVPVASNACRAGSGQHSGRLGGCLVTRRLQKMDSAVPPFPDLRTKIKVHDAEHLLAEPSLLPQRSANSPHVAVPTTRRQNRQG